MTCCLHIWLHFFPAKPALAGEIATSIKGIKDVANDLPEEDKIMLARLFKIAKDYGEENNYKGKGTIFYFMYLHVTFKE